MRYFLDTEFNDRGATVELISIAIVASDGRELYLASTEFDPRDCNEWVVANVLPFVPSAFDARSCSRAEIRDALVAFVGDDKAPEFWAWYAAYDWLVVCQLFGGPLKLPERFPRLCLDLKQLHIHKGRPKLPPHEGRVHDALDDARWDVRVFEFLRSRPWVDPQS